MTVEPGIYIKGFGGVRIEDMVLITKNGCVNLTKVSKSLKDAILE
jgi:Xaa-Pro aminopeptidase